MRRRLTGSYDVAHCGGETISAAIEAAQLLRTRYPQRRIVEPHPAIHSG